MRSSPLTWEAPAFERRLRRRNESGGEASEGGRSPPPSGVGGRRAPPCRWTLLIALDEAFLRQASRCRSASGGTVGTGRAAMTNVAIVGAGKGGRALLEMFSGDPTVSILGVVDLNLWAPGLELARRLSIPVSTNLEELISDPRLDLIIDVTGNADVQREVQRLKPPHTEVMGGTGARFMWDLLADR